MNKYCGHVGSAHSDWTTLGLPWSRVACTSQSTLLRLQVLHRALSQVDPVFSSLTSPKPLRFSSALQEHRPRKAVHSVLFPGPSAQVTECSVSTLSHVGPASYSPS